MSRTVIAIDQLLMLGARILGPISVEFQTLELFESAIGTLGVAECDPVQVSSFAAYTRRRSVVELDGIEFELLGPRTPDIQLRLVDDMQERGHGR